MKSESDPSEGGWMHFYVETILKIPATGRAIDYHRIRCHGESHRFFRLPLSTGLVS